jgi:RimJ/RimL family protein N-acetyltransferase
MIPVNEIKTERLILRPTTIDDAKFVLEQLNMPKWYEFIGDRKVKDLVQAREYITTKLRPQIDKLGYGTFTVIRKSDGIKLGTCGLYDRDGIEGIDIGFAFLTQYEKNGYAFESSNKLKQVAINQFNLKQINAITTISNISSQKLLEKLGLKYIKLIQLTKEGEEVMLYQLNSDESQTRSRNYEAL